MAGEAAGKRRLRREEFGWSVMAVGFAEFVRGIDGGGGKEEMRRFWVFGEFDGGIGRGMAAACRGSEVECFVEVFGGVHWKDQRRLRREGGARVFSDSGKFAGRDGQGRRLGGVEARCGGLLAVEGGLLAERPA